MRPFQSAMFWKLPVRVALVFCTVMSEGLDLAVEREAQCKEWGSTTTCETGKLVMVWAFTVSCLLLVLILPVSFFYFNYSNRSRRHEKPTAITI